MSMVEQSLGQLARSIPGATQVFHEYQLDFCCGGKKSLAEAAAQRILGESVHRDGSQMILFQLQQRHRAAAEVRAQAGHQPLQADCGGKVGNQIGQQEVLHGVNFTVRGALNRHFSG